MLEPLNSSLLGIELPHTPQFGRRADIGLVRWHFRHVFTCLAGAEELYEEDEPLFISPSS